MGTHPQSYLFLIMVTGAFLIYSIFVNKGFRKEMFIISIIVGLCAFLISAHRLLPELEYAFLSKRMSESASGFIPLKFITNMFIPWFFGKGMGAHDYWGGYQGFWMFVEYGAYIGILPLVFLVFSRGLIKEQKLRFFWYLLGFSLFFVYGEHNPLHKPINFFLPGIRFYSRFLPYFSFSAAVLASFSLDNLTKSKIENKSKIMRILVGLIVAVVIGLPILGIWNSTHSYMDGALAYKYSIMSKAWLLFLLFLLISLILLFIYLKGYLKGVYFQIAAILILIIDLFSLGIYFNIGKIDPDKYYQSNSLTMFLKDDYKNEFFRVASGRFGYLYANSRTLMYKIPSTEGKLENSLGRFQNLKTGLRKVNEKRYLDIYNVKYEIRDTVVSGMRSLYPKVRDSYLPRAYIVHRVKSIPDSEIISYMASEDFDPGKEVILVENNEKDLKTSNMEGSDEVIITDYRPESIELEVNLGSDGYLVLSEHYYPSWKAYVDGEEVPILMANYLFRAISIKEGEHLVKFKFNSRMFQIGMILTFIGVLLILITSITRNFKR
jgi:uncharacterized membrane protein YfhO